MKEKIISHSLTLFLVFTMLSCDNYYSFDESLNSDSLNSTSKGESTSYTSNHDFDSNGQCLDCRYIDFSNLSVEAGIKKFGYYVVDEDKSSSYTSDDIVYFGSYPQTLVTNSNILPGLNSMITSLPSLPNIGSWTSFEFYSCNQKEDYAFYLDTIYSNHLYRAVYFTKYRPFSIDLIAENENSYIPENYYLNQVYWFEYSPIKWNLLSYQNGIIKLGCLSSLEAEPFNSQCQIINGEHYNLKEGIFANNWEYSSLRTYLNADFYNLAFNENEKKLIESSELDNLNSGYALEAPYQIVQSNTTDKVFLLSYSDVRNTEYGYTGKGTSRIRSVSGYALIKGARPSTQSIAKDGLPACLYFLRSSGETSCNVCCVSKLGSSQSSVSLDSYDGKVNGCTSGVLPSVQIRILKEGIL